MQLPPILLLGYAHYEQFGERPSRISYVWLLKSLAVKNLVSGDRKNKAQIATPPLICLL